MTRAKRRPITRNEYDFRGRIFRISVDELMTAIQQSRRLHTELIEDLMKEVKRRAGTFNKTSKECSQEVEDGIAYGPKYGPTNHKAKVDAKAVARQNDLSIFRLLKR